LLTAVSALIVSTYHFTISCFILSRLIFAVTLAQKKKTPQTMTQSINLRGDTMAENKVQDYTDDKGEGHVDTREKNF
jgi:hypothetical protein